MELRRRLVWMFVGAVVVLGLEPGVASAYIGPGAGFALAGSFFAVFAAFISAITMVLLWPFRFCLRLMFRRRPPRPPKVKRVVILGLDGLDYGLTVKLLDEGKLPNLASLRDTGCLLPLGSTLPPISPVAWSSFQTGVNPGKHNIFDFLTPDERTYLPKLSSVEIRTSARRIGIGPLSFSYTRPDVRLLRKSRPFWSILGDYGIFSSVIRVPITFPPEKFHGVQLSAMCVPDLRGTQGTFTFYTTRKSILEEKTGGEVIVVDRNGATIRGELLGPPKSNGKSGGFLACPFEVRCINRTDALLSIGGMKHRLTVGKYTAWIPVPFRAGFAAKVSGVCRFLLLGTEPDFELYVTPINIDPERPVMPIGSPPAYPIYLAKRQGSYATLGLAEDTWGLSEEVLSDEQFKQQCVDIDREREEMFFDGLEKVSSGLCVCVFDGTDRMQHMFWRYLDKEHPARPESVPAEHQCAIEDLYARMDDLVGRTIKRCRAKGDVLMVISDHGFNTFRRGVDLNSWLEQQGYLRVDDARRGEQYLAGIDWEHTAAFAIGLTGIFINRRDRFARGILDDDEGDRVAAEIAEKLVQLTDPKTGVKAVRRAYQARKTYRGPYKEHAPDVIVGYESGYRVSWDAAVGKTSPTIFSDNKKAWSGDHCVDPSVVPGVLFCNRRIEAERPRLLDLGPTVLDLFGIPTPDHMDGKPLSVHVASGRQDTRTTGRVRQAVS